VMDMHWPTGSGPYSRNPQVKVETSDLVEILLNPSRVPPVRDTYETFDRRRRELIRTGYPLTPYQVKPSDRYSGLLEYVSFNKFTGQPNPYGYYVSKDGMPRTPSGNPYMISGQVAGTEPSKGCDTTIALPEGNDVRVRFRKKHLSDWHRIYPEVLRLIESSRRGEPWP